MTDEVLKFLKALFPVWIVQLIVLIAGGVAFFKWVLKPLSPQLVRLWNFVSDYEVQTSIKLFPRFLLCTLAYALPGAVALQIMEYRWIDFNLKYAPKLLFINLAVYLLMGAVGGIPMSWLPTIVTFDEKRPFDAFLIATLFGCMWWGVLLFWKLLRVAFGFDPMLCVSC